MRTPATVSAVKPGPPVPPAPPVPPVPPVPPADPGDPEPSIGAGGPYCPPRPPAPPAPCAPIAPGVPAVPVAPVIVALFRRNTEEPGFHVPPVRSAGVAVLEAPLLAVLKNTALSDSDGVPSLLARLTSFSTAASVRTLQLRCRIMKGMIRRAHSYMCHRDSCRRARTRICRSHSLPYSTSARHRQAI